MFTLPFTGRVAERWSVPHQLPHEQIGVTAAVLQHFEQVVHVEEDVVVDFHQVFVRFGTVEVEQLQHRYRLQR